MKKYDFIVVGSGCAGIGFFLQILKETKNILLIEKERICGKIFQARNITNLLGFESIDGESLCKKVLSQLNGYEEKIVLQKVLDIEGKGDSVIVRTGKKEYFTDYCIVSTGTSERKLKKYKDLDLKTEHKKIVGKKICIIGGGEISFDKGLSLVETGKNVYLFSIGNFLKVNGELFREGKKKFKSILPFTKILNIKRKNKDSFIISFSRDGKIYEEEFDDILLSIGSIREIPIIRKKNNRIILCGSVKGKMYKQCSIAFADGVKLAMKISQKRRMNGNRSY